MTREEKLVILTELVKEDAITLEEAFGLAEDCEIEIGEFDDEDEEDEKEEVVSILDIISRIQSKMKEVDTKIKESENQRTGLTSLANTALINSFAKLKSESETLTRFIVR
jgi:hypothetical protein